MPPYFQPVFIFRGVALLGAFLLVACFAAYGFLWYVISGGAGHPGEPVLQRIAPMVWFAMILYGIVAAQFILVGGVFFTHKVAGPLIRLERMTAEAVTGSLPEAVHFREGDQMQPLALAQGRMFAFLAERERQVATAGARAEKACETLADGLLTATPAEWEKMAAALEEELAAVAAATQSSPGGG